MAAARLDLPAVFVYGGSILPARLGNTALDIVSVFEAVGATCRGKSERRGALPHRAQRMSYRGPCAGMFTANTMASAAEALGMSLPGSASPPAVDRRRDDLSFGREKQSSSFWSSSPPAPDNDQAGVQKRDRGGDGAWRVDERCAASSRHRPRGAGGPHLDDFNEVAAGFRILPTPSRTGGSTWWTSIASGSARRHARLLEAGLIDGAA